MPTKDQISAEVAAAQSLTTPPSPPGEGGRGGEAAAPRRRTLFMGDRVIWVVFFFLCIISLVEVYSAASALSYKNGEFWMPLLRQGGFLLGGTVLVIALHHIPCRMFKIMPLVMLPVSIILLLWTLVAGTTLNEGARWLNLFGISFQPSEVAKWTLVVSVALVLGNSQQKEGADRRAFRWIMIMTVPICFLIFIENLSTAVLIFGVVFLMMFVGRVPLAQLGKLISACLIMGLLLVGLVALLGDKVPVFHRAYIWEGRVVSFIAGESSEENDKDPAKFDIDENAQVGHARIAVARSKGVGCMPGNSVERDFLPQAYSDFIFVIIIEEMGAWGAAIVVLLYLILLFRAGRIASRCERNFPAFLILGLALMFVSQALLNMMVAVGLFPVTGQPLPLISRGGTSTLIFCGYVGMMLSVSRYAKRTKEPAHTHFDGSMANIRHED